MNNTPEYSSNLFVNREKEIQLVLDKALRMTRGEPVRERTIVFWGYKGTGRTWLLRRVTELLEEMPGIKPLYIDLDLYTSRPVVEAISNLPAQAAKNIWGPGSSRALLYERAANVPLPTLAAWLVSDIEDLLLGRVLVLLLDHVYESDWDLLAEIEDDFLAYLAHQSRVLLVMAGRGQAYPWYTPELRLYVQEYLLKPFNQSLTEKQLEVQKPDAVSRAAEIHKISHGYPLGNILLAAWPTVIEAMQETVGGLLEGVLSEERSWLEALCVLRIFDEERIPRLLAAYFEDESIAEWPYREIRQTRDRLLGTGMVRWKEEAGGWVVDEAIRPVLERYLQETKPEVWRRLHCAAYQLYKDWERWWPDEQWRWREEASHHAKCLSSAGYDPEECPQSLGQE